MAADYFLERERVGGHWGRGSIGSFLFLKENGRKGCLLGTPFRGWGWRTSQHALGRHSSSGPLVMLLSGCPPCTGLSGFLSFLCCYPDLEGTVSQDFPFTSWVEATWCWLNDQPDNTSLAVQRGKGSDLLVTSWKNVNGWTNSK